MFVDREEELRHIREKLESDKFELIALYGRRRIGKTRLILEAVKGKEHIYYLAVEGDNLKYFRNVASRVVPDIKYVEKDWESYFRFLKNRIVVIDEFPNLIRENKNVVSLFQRIVDMELQNTRTKIILSGSSISMMSEKVLSYRSPLYGRRTSSLKLQPLKFRDIILFFPEAKPRELVEIYGFAGGVPYYLKKVKTPFWKWLEREFKNPGSFVKDEIDFIMKYEFEEAATYKKILEAIAMGKNTPKEMKEYIGMRHSDITPYIRNLIYTEFVEREVPVTENIKSKRGRYFIKDNFTAFWFRYIFPNLSAIEEGIFDVNLVKKDYPRYLGRVFEHIAKEFIIERSRMGKMPFRPMKIGRWWYKNEEIDIVAINENSGDILFAEIKWRDNINGERIVEELREKARMVRWKNENRKEYFLVFARSFKKKISGICFDLNDILMYSKSPHLSNKT